VCGVSLHSGHVFKRNGILLKSRLCSRLKCRNAWGFMKQSMVVWKMSCLNGFHHARMNSITVDGLTVKTKVIKKLWRWTFILYMPADRCSIPKSSGTLDCYHRRCFGKEVSRTRENNRYLLWPKEHFESGWNDTSYHAPMKSTPALKGEKCQGVKECKDRVMVLLCWNTDGSKKLCQLIMWKF
jgi:hypothetical protein